MTSEGAFRIIQAAIFTTFLVHRGYYSRKHPRSEENVIVEQVKGRVDLVANLLSVPALLGLALYVVHPKWMAWASFRAPGWAGWAGVLVAVAGFVLLQWSHQALGQNWSDQPMVTKSQALTTRGPYRRIRYPIYTSFLMILGSTFLITANWFIGTIWIATTAIDIRSRIRFEELKLRERFGKDYESYKESTGGLLPRLW